MLLAARGASPHGSPSFPRGVSMRCRRIGAVFIAVSGLAAWQHTSDSPFSPSSAQNLTVQDLATSASVAGVQGTLKNGQAPSTGGGPNITASGNQAVINGGTLVVTIQAASPFTTIYMFVG